MKIFSLAFIAVSSVHGGLTVQERFARAFGLLESWIDDNTSDFKKHAKLSNRLDFMNTRLTSNLADGETLGCILSPSDSDLDDIDAVCFRNYIQYFKYYF